MNKTGKTNTRLIVVSVFLGGGTFVIDLSLPLGVAGGVPYVALVLVSLWLPRPRHTLIAAAAASVLTILGFFLSPMGSVVWVVLVNRFLALFAIWVTAILGLQRKKVEEKLKALNETLKQRIAERTSQLEDSRANALNRIDDAEEARRKAEQAEERFRGFVEFAPDATVIVNRKGEIVLVNKQTEELFGYRRQELLGQPIEILVPERFHGVHMKHHVDYFPHPSVRPMGANLDLRALRKDGSEFPVEISLSPFETEEGITVTSAIRDITERKQAEEQIQRHSQHESALYDINVAITSTLRLHTVLEILMEKIELTFSNSATEIWLFNEESRALERMSCRNLDEEEWKGRKLGTTPALPKEVVDKKLPVVVKNIQTDPRVADPGFFRKHGLVSYIGVPLVAKGKVFGVLTVLTRKEYLFNNEEIDFLTALATQASTAIHNSQLYEQTKNQAVEMERANKVKDEFLDVMSHELRTPLNVIVGYTEMIKEGMLV